MSNKIFILGGTAGELIKLYPLIIRFEKISLDWNFIFTGQSPVNFINQWIEFKLPLNKLIKLTLTDKDLRSSLDALKWFLKVILIKKVNLVKLIGSVDNNSFYIVHGDTLSTLSGVFISKRLNAKKIIHIEAGLRSPFLLKPFPEEITRRLVSSLANIHFAPNLQAVQNLIKSSFVRGKVINTHGNTLFDAVREIDDIDNDINKKIGFEKYVLVNIHRFENINSFKRWDFIIKFLINISKKYKILFVLHPVTEKKFNKLLIDNPLLFSNFVVLSRLSFNVFINLLKKSEFIITDGGSNQEECSFINKPCLIMRDGSERPDGLLKKVCVISKFDHKICHEFLLNYKKFSYYEVKRYDSPTDLILKNLNIINK